MFLSNKKEKGQGLVEYALILVLVAVIVLAVMVMTGSTISTVYCSVVVALDPGAICDSGEAQDFGSTQWKNGWDQATPIDNYCASEGSGAQYNLYLIDAGTDYYIASGFPWTGSDPSTFLNTGTCP